MKKLIVLFASLFCLFCFGMDEGVRQGLNVAVESAAGSISQANLGRVTVALLPIRGDVEGIVAGRLKNALTSAGCTVVEGKEDSMLDELVKQIDWEHKKEDLLDASTISRFGSLKSAKVLIYGTVRDAERNGDRIYVELELHATEVATAQHIWGGTFVGRFYTGKDIHGIISLDPDLKALLAKNFEAACTSLKEVENTGRFTNIQSTAVIPMAGDIDQYLTGLAIGMLTQTSLHPKACDISTVSQVRATQRDGKFGADAFLYGALRDLSRQDAPAYDTSAETASVVNADIQLFLEDSRSGEILWSKTIAMSEMVMSKKVLTNGEKVVAEVVDVAKGNSGWLKWTVLAVVIIIALGVAIGIIRSATNVR